ncbi:MAG: hypothetical protein DCC49_07765 [Acidobacteria bacterium]|nr:MAG: hypothetical protein DCC49_07765 [Acidobacteriota bacterium]
MSSDIRASVVILSRHHPEMLLACLDSIEKNVSSDLNYEIILLLNGADPEITHATADLGERVRVITSNVNLGFPGGCNRASEFARGDYLVFLNDDTIVYRGWLESLVETADRIPEAGAVGSLVFNPDSTIQEAGAIVWSDGVTSSIDSGRDIESAQYYFLRDADYCSACSILVRHSTWHLVGGMDEEYFPGYYEDVDLCFKIQQAGQRVIFDPGSALMHFRSASTESDYKMFLVQKHIGTLRQKWAALIATHEDREPDSPISIDSAIQRARGYPTKVIAVGLRPEDLQSLPKEPRGLALSVSVSGATGDDRIRAGRLGINLIWEEPDRHLSRPGINYDYAIVADQAISQHLSKLQGNAESPMDVIALPEHAPVDRSQVLSQLLNSLQAQSKAGI